MAKEGLDIKDLIAKRGYLKSALTRFETHVNTIDKDKFDVVNLEEHVNHNSTLVLKFQDIQSEIETLSTDQTHPAYREQFETLYFEIIATAKTLITNRNAKATLSKQVKLPKIDIPKFDLSYERWASFHDTFSLLVHLRCAKIISNTLKRLICLYNLLLNLVYYYYYYLRFSKCLKHLVVLPSNPNRNTKPFQISEPLVDVQCYISIRHD